MKIKVRAEVMHILEEHYQCRALGHAWAYTSARKNPRERAQRRWQQDTKCARCLTERRQYMDPDGELTETMYRYPKGYLIQGIGHLTKKERGWIRLQSMEVLR